MALTGRTGEGDESLGVAIAGLLLIAGSVVAFALIVWVLVKREEPAGGDTSSHAAIVAFLICVGPFVLGTMLAFFGVSAGLMRLRCWAFVIAGLQLVLVAGVTVGLYRESLWPMMFALLTAMVAGGVVLVRRRTPVVSPGGICRGCGSSLEGLPRASPCPECGASG